MKLIVPAIGPRPWPWAQSAVQSSAAGRDVAPVGAWDQGATGLPVGLHKTSADGGMGGTGRLWAPWRHVYLSQPKRRGCVFCLAKRSRRDDRRLHVIARGRRIFVLLNRYPYNPGHLMIAVYRHVGALSRVTHQEASELMEAASRMTQVLTKALHPQGFNIGVNVGRVAGAGIPGHLHMHVVPRWNGDTNFMPVTGDTRVLSESLDALHERLTTHLNTASFPIP